MSYAGDPSAPPGRASIIETVRNKNNKEEVRLRRRLTEYSKELATKIVQIDHDRLDAFDFLRQLRMCESDYMTEFAAFREEKAKLAELMERRDSMSTYDDDSEYDTPVPLSALNGKTTAGQTTGQGAPGDEASGEKPGLTRQRTFLRMVFGRGQSSFLGPVPVAGSGLSPVQQKILHIQQDALLNNKDEKQRAAIMQLRGTAVSGHPHGGRAAREAARRQRQRLRKPITRRIREFYDRVDDLTLDDSDGDVKTGGETAAVTPALPTVGRPRRPVVVIPQTA
ncbi:hypothetical protein NP493_271g03024 [Ridgeia piscesae]|uniref:Uncharacterized protein n=1 Tax=Ridgeia piscesae TaxID=27915 RepID=A0AAD9NXK8_RIDPI|nr:hypothetical protein NP493_271g03024 [Ridgeia piscesae]